MTLALSGQKVACRWVWIDLGPAEKALRRRKSVLTLGGERKFQTAHRARRELP